MALYLQFGINGQQEVRGAAGVPPGNDRKSRRFGLLGVRLGLHRGFLRFVSILKHVHFGWSNGQKWKSQQQQKQTRPKKKKTPTKKTTSWSSEATTPRRQSPRGQSGKLTLLIVQLKRHSRSIFPFFCKWGLWILSSCKFWRSGAAPRWASCTDPGDLLLISAAPGVLAHMASCHCHCLSKRHPPTLHSDFSNQPVSSALKEPGV